MNDAHQWFHDAGFGIFVHFGPYAQIGRGEQSLLREHMDQTDYAKQACQWNPSELDMRQWAKSFRAAGANYAVLTTRHHDGYCLWDTQYTDYSAAKQAPQRDFVREFVDACREEGLKVGLYYSLGDWRIPAFWNGPQHDPKGWAEFTTYVHNQVEELCTNYGQIDVIWFDGAWPHSAAAWKADRITETIRRCQPACLINNRLGRECTGGDFTTPEHYIEASEGLWESCQVTTWRLWGYHRGERWKSTARLLDLLCETASKGGNLLLNVGPDGEGRLPEPCQERFAEIGRWLKVHGEAVYGVQPRQLFEAVSLGWITARDNDLYLILRFWDNTGTIPLPGLLTPPDKIELLGCDAAVTARLEGERVLVENLPAAPPTELFPVIKMTFAEAPVLAPWAVDGLWTGNARRYAPWAAKRGTSVWADGKPREN